MHTTIAAIFSEHDQPKHCPRAKVATVNGPLLDIAADLQAQLAEYRRLMMRAEMAPDLPDDFRGKLESFNQTLKAGDRVVQAFIDNGRELLKIMVQLDRYMSEAKEATARFDARQRATVAGEK